MRNKKGRWFLHKHVKFIVFVSLVIIVLVFLTMFSKSKKASLDFDWSGIRTEVKDSIKLMSEKGERLLGRGGYAGYERSTDIQFWFLLNVNDSELKQLLNYPDGFIKAMSYEALIRKGENNTFDLMKRAFSDTIAYFSVSSGCTSEYYLIGEYLIDNVVFIEKNIPQLPRTPSYIKELTNEQIDTLLLLNEKRKINKDRYILKAIELEEK
jgi:hypothetical protein